MSVRVRYSSCRERQAVAFSSLFACASARVSEAVIMRGAGAALGTHLRRALPHPHTTTTTTQPHRPLPLPSTLITCSCSHASTPTQPIDFTQSPLVFGVRLLPILRNIWPNKVTKINLMRAALSSG